MHSCVSTTAEQLHGTCRCCQYKTRNKWDNTSGVTRMSSFGGVFKRIVNTLDKHWSILSWFASCSMTICSISTENKQIFKYQLLQLPSFDVDLLQQHAIDILARRLANVYMLPGFGQMYHHDTFRWRIICFFFSLLDKTSSTIFRQQHSQPNSSTVNCFSVFPWFKLCIARRHSSGILCFLAFLSGNSKFGTVWLFSIKISTKSLSSNVDKYCSTVRNRCPNA